jgi:hypothetical protein
MQSEPSDIERSRREPRRFSESCPRCGLIIHVRASFLLPYHCPRCVARARKAVPMVSCEDADPGGLTAA